jgi:predicted enzyme related to lactoylglutathione lyase
MTLANARIDLTLPVVDLERAKAFYGEILGLKPLDLPAPDLASEMALFEAGEGAQFALYRREEPTKADHTSASFRVSDVEATIAELSQRGVVFEQYDMPGLKTDGRGIAVMGPFKTAFMKDTEGNILGVVEG